MDGTNNANRGKEENDDDDSDDTSNENTSYSEENSDSNEMNVIAPYSIYSDLTRHVTWLVLDI